MKTQIPVLDQKTVQDILIEIYQKSQVENNLNTEQIVQDIVNQLRVAMISNAK